MRRRDREINIFNIAFLDVITGAMGAFILLVLLLAPYYTGPSAPPPSMKKVQRAVNRAATEAKNLEREIDRAMKAGVVPKLLAKLEKLLKKLKAQLAAADTQLIRLRSEINLLESKNRKLQQENRKLKAQVRQDRDLIRKLEAEIAELKAEIQQLQQTIAKQRQRIQYLEQHQGTSVYRPLTVLVERVHTPNGRFNAGAPFIVASRTFWKAGVKYSRGKESIALHNDPPFNLMDLLKVSNLGEMLKGHAIPFPHQTDVRLWPVKINNGAGVATRSPDAIMLQVQQANLRSRINIWVAMLSSRAAGTGGGKLNSSATLLLTATYGKDAFHQKLYLSIAQENAAERFTFIPLPHQKMKFTELPPSSLGRNFAYLRSLESLGRRP